MFTTTCKHCHKENPIDGFPAEATVNCCHCGQSNALENESHYLPRLIVIQGGEKGKEYPFKEDLSLGRDTSNTIQLKELKSSRRHAKIEFQDGKYYLEDLKSGNGTFLNGNKVTQAPLRDKDLIHVAETIFMFRNPYFYLPGVENREATPGLPADGQVKIKTVARGDKTVKTVATGSKPLPDLLVPERAFLAESQSGFERTRAELKFDAQRSFMMSSQELRNIAEVEKANAKLRILYEVNNAISSILDLQELLGTILDVVFRQIPAERGAILLYDADRDSLETTVAKVRNRAEEGPFKISKTMMNRVVKERISLLTTDAMLDDSYAEAMSIISEGIRSSMSVPLVSKEKLLGVLHIDTTQISAQFNSDTLELLTGIASLAAISIENAKLIKKIEREIETRGHLQRYLSPELVEQIINQQIDMKIGGELKKATVLFTDLRGFTKLTENIGAEAIVAILNDYFTRMVDIIFGNHGTLDKFIGDAIMAIWGLPIGDPNDALNAVKTAIQMQQDLFYFNIGQREKGRASLKMGAGINTGELVVGNMGSPKRMEYTVIGSTVNLASRVETQTAHNQILISEFSYEQVAGRVFGVQLPPAPLKGIQRPVTIYGIVSLKDAEGRVETFLPVLIQSPVHEDKKYEGMLQSYANGKMEFHVEPAEDLAAGQSLTLSLDLPSIGPTNAVRIRCQKIEKNVCRSAEILRLEAEIEEIPENVAKFLQQALSLS